MRKPLLFAGIAVLLLPMLFVMWLIAASFWPAMDATTMHAPESLRKSIAQMIMNREKFSQKEDAAIRRVLRFDPENPVAWQRRCVALELKDGLSTDIPACESAVRIIGDSESYLGLAQAQELKGDFCKAEESYTKAAGLAASSGEYTYTEGLGRAAYLCGDLIASRAGFETAVELEGKLLDARDDDEDDVVSTRSDMLKDRESLIVLYGRIHENGLAAKVCRQAHSDWKHCNCTMDAKGKASCTQG